MDLKQLEYFVCVAELGSFTRASITLDIAQPALSRQVRMLEVELRQNLLLRNGRGVTPTEAGKLLMEHARGILHQVQTTHEALGKARGAMVGKIAIGIPPTIARIVTVPLTQKFRQELPEVQLSICEGLSCNMQEWMLTGRLDIAAVYHATALTGLDTEHLFNDPLVLLSPHQQAETTAEIELATIVKKPLIIPSRPNAIRIYLETKLASLGLQPLIRMEIDSIAGILDVVKNGIGCAVLPSSITNHIDTDAFTIQKITSPNLFASVYLSSSANRPLTLAQQAALKLFRSILVKECQEKSRYIQHELCRPST